MWSNSKLFLLPVILFQKNTLLSTFSYQTIVSGHFVVFVVAVAVEQIRKVDEIDSLTETVVVEAWTNSKTTQSAPTYKGKLSALRFFSLARGQVRYFCKIAILGGSQNSGAQWIIYCIHFYKGNLIIKSSRFPRFEGSVFSAGPTCRKLIQILFIDWVCSLFTVMITIRDYHRCLVIPNPKPSFATIGGEGQLKVQIDIYIYILEFIELEDRILTSQLQPTQKVCRGNQDGNRRSSL